MVFLRMGNFKIRWLLFVFAATHILVQQCEGAYENVSYTVTPDAAYFSSPGYPTAYSDNLTLEVTFRSSTPSEVLFLEFTDCEIEYANLKVPVCQVDMLTIYDGPYDNATILYNDCCMTLPSNLQSSGEYLFLKFISDSTITARGFQIKYYNNGTSSPTDGVASANALYIAVGLTVVVLIGCAVAIGFACKKILFRSKNNKRIDPLDDSNTEINDSVFDRDGSTFNRKIPITPPDSPIPPPKKWSPTGGMKIDDSMIGPKLKHIPDLLVFNRELPDGNSRANRLPPVQESSVNQNPRDRSDDKYIEPQAS